jgi:pimeloyl-ACP methyl ester carboxylesterase
MRARVLRSLVAALVCTSLSSACLFSRGPVGVNEVRPEDVRAAVSAFVLDGKVLSASTREVLESHDLQDVYDRDRLAALRALHARAVVEPRPADLFGLAEISYLIGYRRRDPDAYLASAVYAYTFLLGQQNTARANPYDRRFRWACDLYNDALMRAYTAPDGHAFAPAAGLRTLPIGSLRVARKDEGEVEDIASLLPADRYHVRGLKLRLRDSGLGVPLIGVLERDAEREGSRLWLHAKEMPLTAFLRLDGSLAELEAGIDATLELHHGYEASTITVEGQDVPLESDRSATLAHALDRSEVWSFSFSGFFSSESAARSNRLILVQPYQHGRVPVVFVHGTASSPGYWADLFNSLWGDPELRSSAQFWFYRYTTGNPIPYSAAELRAALAEAVQTLDPDGDDPALRRMVVIGHSQGGLLAKLMVVADDRTWFEEATGMHLDELELSPGQESDLLRSLEFEPAPSVARVVFVSTPHRGSFVSDTWYSRLLANLIRLPQDLSAIGRDVLGRSERLPPELRRMPTSVSGMRTDSPYLEHLVGLPLAPGVVAHSIVSIGDADPRDPEDLADADDGVVSYGSAHVDGVASEFLVPCGHSSQSHPGTIQEVRRILLEHVRASDRP